MTNFECGQNFVLCYVKFEAVHGGQGYTATHGEPLVNTPVTKTQPLASFLQARGENLVLLLNLHTAIKNFFIAGCKNEYLLVLLHGPSIVVRYVQVEAGHKT